MCIACSFLNNKIAPRWVHSPAPQNEGVLVLQESLENLVPFIDWSYFLYAWHFPCSLKILDEDSSRGEEARRLLQDGKNFLQQIVERKMCEARSVVGLFPVTRQGDDVLVQQSVCDDPVTFHFLRQQHNLMLPCRSLVDFLSPKCTDYMGFFALSAGFGVKEGRDRLKSAGDDYSAILLETLSGRLTEAYSTKLHLDVIQKYWGYGEHLTAANAFGIRPAIGYPSIPDHTEKQTLWRLLKVKENIGIELTDSFMMMPLNSACGYYFAHPKSSYFSVGKIGMDQLKDYAERKGWSLETARTWLNNWVQ
ncbi:MAG: hypothetical protein HUK21_05640 [Fibrobacteraceae bacterium]|nr:hypothetical protein [Fibrobacteraceae bacterium]